MIVWRCDSPGCEREEPALKWRDEEPPPGWHRVTARAGGGHPLVWQVQACSPEHAVAAIASALAVAHAPA